MVLGLEDVVVENLVFSTFLWARGRDGRCPVGLTGLVLL